MSSTSSDSAHPQDSPSTVWLNRLRRSPSIRKSSPETVCLLHLDDSDHNSQLKNKSFLFQYPPNNTKKKHDNKNGMNHSVSIEINDVSCLIGDGFLNDSIMDFWFQYCFDKRIHDKDKERVLILSALTWQSISSLGTTRNSRIPEYKGIKATKNVNNLFMMDFIFLPIAQKSHWLLAVICFPWMVFHEKNLKRKAEDTDSKHSGFLQMYHSYWKRKFERRKRLYEARSMILIFDSFTELGVDHEVIGNTLRNYLDLEWKFRYPDAKTSFTATTMPLNSPEVQQQGNYFDCGVFVLQYFSSFFNDPIPSFTEFPSLKNWFAVELVKEKRKEIQNRIYRYVQKYNPDQLPILTQHTLLQDEEIGKKKNSTELQVVEKASPPAALVQKNSTELQVVEKASPPAALVQPRKSRRAKKSLNSEAQVKLSPRIFNYPELELESEL